MAGEKTAHGDSGMKGWEMGVWKKKHGWREIRERCRVMPTENKNKQERSVKQREGQRDGKGFRGQGERCSPGE